MVDTQPQNQATARMTRLERESFQAGSLAFSQGDNQRALESLGRVLEACPRYADVHYMVGLVHERLGDLDAAAACLERAVDINPRYVEATVALSALCERRGDFDNLPGAGKPLPVAGSLNRLGLRTAVVAGDMKSASLNGRSQREPLTSTGTAVCPQRTHSRREPPSPSF